MLLELGDRILGYDDVGPREGDAVVFLHSFLLDRRQWQLQLDRRALHTRMLTLDFRGLGESTGSGTVDDAADDVVSLLDAREVERATVVGLSMGGYVALAFARRHPRRLEGLLLADTRATADDDKTKATRDETITRVAQQSGTVQITSQLLPRLLTGRDVQAVKVTRAMGETQSPVGVAGALAALRDRPDATPGLAAIAVPTTVLVGAEDVMTTPEEMRAMAAAIPGADFVQVAGAGHLANLEAPREFSRAIEVLVARVRSARR